MPPVVASSGALATLIEQVECGAPVLRATVLDLARLEAQADSVGGNALANAILRDALMTLRVLRFLQGHRTRSQTQDITTIAHAIMMLGQARFFREFHDLPCLEDAQDMSAQRLDAVHQAMSRARLAALFARDWAVQRHDMDPEEVMVAALLHDVVEPLILLAPQGAVVVPEPGVQAELRALLFVRAGLPGLLGELTDDADASAHPRVLNVRIACALARALEAGWLHPGIDTELARIQRLLHVSAAEVWERVRRVALQAAREWRVFGVAPAAARLPQLPDDRPAAL